MSLSASSGLFLTNHDNDFSAKFLQNKKKVAKSNNKIQQKKQEPQTENLFNIAQKQQDSHMSTEDSVRNTQIETLGTMAYNNSGAESAGTMANASSTGGTTTSVSCVA